MEYFRNKLNYMSWAFINICQPMLAHAYTSTSVSDHTLTSLWKDTSLTFHPCCFGDVIPLGTPGWSMRYRLQTSHPLTFPSHSDGLGYGHVSSSEVSCFCRNLGESLLRCREEA